MKLIHFILFLFISIYSNGQYHNEMQLRNYNEIAFQDKSVKKIKEINSIIKVVNNQELTDGFKKYRRLRYIHQFFARLRDFGLFYGVVNETFQPRINPIPLSIGLASAGAEIFTKKRTQRSLEKLVDNYNYLVSAF